MLYLHGQKVCCQPGYPVLFCEHPGSQENKGDFQNLNPTKCHCTTLLYTALNCTILRYTAMHCTALHRTTLHWTVLHLTALHCTARLCTALHSTGHAYWVFFPARPWAGPEPTPGSCCLLHKAGLTAMRQFKEINVIQIWQIFVVVVNRDIFYLYHEFKVENTGG